MRRRIIAIVIVLSTLTVLCINPPLLYPDKGYLLKAGHYQVIFVVGGRKANLFVYKPADSWIYRPCLGIDNVIGWFAETGGGCHIGRIDVTIEKEKDRN